MIKAGRVLVVGVILTGGSVGFMQVADARPTHLKVFATTYPLVAARNQMTCAVCHAGGDRKMHNNYGEALARNIATRERDEALVKQALALTEGEPSAIPGKTFGDLLKLGLLPASKVANGE